MEEYDIVIQGASIVDGSGRPPYKSSIAIKGDKVEALGDISRDAKELIEASGLTAVPGFIDSHSHADGSILFFPKCESLMLQGVTTFVGGECGISPAPIGDKISLPGAAHEYIGELISFKYYPPSSRFPRDRVNAIMKEKFGWTVDWRTMGDFFKIVESRGISCNYAPLLGHGAVRSYVMGDDFKRRSTKEEKSQMAELIRQGLQDGCIGMSVGLDYDPDVFASRDELVEHVSILKEYNAVFSPHSRRTGRRRDMAMGHRMPDKVDALREVIDLCRATRVPMNIAHLFTGWYINPQHGPSILEETNRRATLMIIDEALKEGLDISFDVIPPSLPTRFGGWSYLCSLLLPWLRQYGTREKLAKWLKVPDFRAEVKEAIYRGKWYIREGYNPNTNPRWAENITVLKHKNTTCENKSVAKVAEERNKDPFETWLDLIVEDPDSKCAIGGDDPDAPYHVIFYQHPASSVGLDTGVTSYDWESKVPPWSVTGMSTFSAYPGFFEKFVKRQKALTIEQAVNKTSTQVAKRHNLKDRGMIRERYYADIVLMDFEDLKVMGTPLEPKLPPKGIEYVFVNGVPVVRKGAHTGAMPGRILRRQ